MASEEETIHEPSSQSQSRGAQKGLSLQFDPAPAAGEYSPLYTATPTCHMASTNAGDLDLYVGGGAINWAFGDLFKREQGLQFGKVSQPYAALHKALLAASRASGGSVASASSSEELAALLPQLSLCAAFGWAGDDLDGDKKGFEGATASVFLDIFAADARPLKQEYNVAMLYVVGPVGAGCTRKGLRLQPALERDDFLKCVERLGHRSVQAVQTYNKLRLEPEHSALPPIEELRWCLVSGGVYKHQDVTKLEVAAATLRGMLQVSSADLRLTFSYDEDVFRLASLGQLKWREYLKMGNIATKKCVETVQQFAQSIPEWVATEKVHGANFCFMTDGVNIEWAKRTSKLAAGENFMRAQEQMPRYHACVLKAFESLKASMGDDLTTLCIYGEYFGGWYPGCKSQGLPRVQIGIAYAPDHNFIPFDVWAGTANAGRFLDFDEQVALLTEAGFPLVMEPVVRGNFAEVSSIEVEGLLTSIPRRLGLPAIAEHQQAEGVVIRPTAEPKGIATGQAPRLMLKKKARAFWEVTNQSSTGEPQAAKAAKLSAAPALDLSELPEEVLPLVEAARRYLTMNRLSAVVSKEGPALLEPHMTAKLTGLFVKDVCEELFQDEEEATKELKAPALKALKKAVHVQASLFLADHAAQLKAELQ